MTATGLAIGAWRILTDTNINQVDRKPKVNSDGTLPVFAAPNAQDWNESPFASIETVKSKPTPDEPNSNFIAFDATNEIKISASPSKTTAEAKFKKDWQQFLSNPIAETGQQIKLDIPPEFYQTVPTAQIDAFGNKIAASFKSARIGEDSSEIVIAYNPVILLTQINEYTNEYLKKTKEIDPNAKIIEEVKNTFGERLLIIRYSSNKNQKPWLEREIFIALPQGFNSGLSISFTTTPMFSEKQAIFFEIARSFL